LGLRVSPKVEWCTLVQVKSNGTLAQGDR
jgi:hypothetical protein